MTDDRMGIVRSEAYFLLYQTEDGRTRVEVCLDSDIAWLSLGPMAQNINCTRETPRDP